MKIARIPNINATSYEKLYTESIDKPDIFWAKQATEFLSWYKKWKRVSPQGLSLVDAKWFEGGTLNASYNCIDRHIESGYGEQVAYYFESNDGVGTTITYATLRTEVSKLANALKNRGIKKGDTVCIYMPMIPEAIYAMLACARIGAVHTVVFGGFSSEALRSRVEGSGCTLILTAEISTRGNKIIPLKKRVLEILPLCQSIHTVIVVQNTDQCTEENDCILDYQKIIKSASDICPPTEMQAEDPLFILYTSGSTGKPKGVVHTTGGYLLNAAMTHTYVFDYHPGDVYWCTADIGWITGHTYSVYGPLCNRATSVFFEGIPTYPNASRYWNIVDKYKVNIFYSTPTTIRMLMALGDEFVKTTSRKSLVILGSVGEPINPEAWRWYYTVVGNSDCYIVDTWWQTETGGHAIAPLPGVITNPKPGAAMIPFFGIRPVIVNEKGNEIPHEGEGVLLLKGSWPSQIRDLHKDHERFIETYLRPYPGYYFTGDGAKRDLDGHLWITGRVDDTMNIAGRLIGTAELESALVLHDSIAEAAVVAVPHEIMGFSIYAFVCPIHGTEPSEKVDDELYELVKQHIGSFAKPEKIIHVPALPKTRSGKIMRRILRKIAQGETESLGDVSTLAEPDVVNEIIKIINR